MSRYQRLCGSHPLLFERLVGPVAGARPDPADLGPTRMHDEADLRASVARELADLLNTHAPLPMEVLERRTRSAIDYGIPDLSAFPVGQHDAMIQLAKHVRNAILAYEPRLHHPVVEIGRGAQSAEALTVIVRGALELGMMRMPVVFELPLGAADAA